MSTAQQNRDAFAYQFNALLGARIGKPVATYTDAQIANRIPASDALKAALMGKHKAATTPKKGKVTPVTTPTDAATILGLGSGKGKMNPKTGEIEGSKASNKVTPTTGKVNVKDIPKAERPDMPKESGGFSLKGLVKGIQHTAGNVAEYVGLTDKDPESSGSFFDALHAANTGEPTQAAMRFINRPVDVSNRIMYAADEAGLRLGRGESIGSIAHGAVSGLAGTRKTGFREVLDEAVPDDYLHPALKTVLSFGAETAMNPLTYTTGGTVRAARGATSAAIKSGVEKTGLGAYKQEFGKAIEESLDTLTDPVAKGALGKTKVTKINKGRIAGTKTVEQVIEPTLTRAEPGKYYHGSSSPIPEFQQYTGKSAENLYGPGVYTTDTGSIAGKYTKKGAGVEPNVYRVEWAGEAPPKVLNLEKPSPELHQVISDMTESMGQSEWFDTSEEAWNAMQEVLANPNAKGKEVYSTFRKMLADGRMHSAEADDIMHDVNSLLRDPGMGGFDAMSHTGGEVTKGQKHGVTIWLDPNNVKIVENVTEHATPRTITSEMPNRVGGSVTRQSIKERVVQQSQEALDNMIYEEKSGRTIGGGPRDVHGTLTETGAEGLRTALIDEVQPARVKFVNAVSAGKRYSAAEFKAMRERNPLFGKWLDAAEEVQAEARAAGTKLDAAAIGRMADGKFSESLSPIIDELRSSIKGNLSDRVTRVGRISFGKHDVYLPRLSRMVQDLHLGGKIPENFRRAYLMSSWLPGYTGHVSNKLRSTSKLELEAFKEELQTVASGTTLAERKLIKSATEADVTLPGKLGEIQAKQVEMYKKMYDDEIEMGVRSKADSPYAKNYTFNRIKGGTSKLQDANLSKHWIEPRKASIKALEGNVKGWTGIDAKNMGLKIEEDFADALVQRKVRSLNKMTKTNLSRDLVSHYGIKSKIPVGELFKQDLVKINPTDMPEWLAKELRPGENIYLHKDIQKVLEDYNDLMAFNQTKEARNFVKGIENLTQIYKVANTMYWPGFHMRNMMSDFFMGMLDGVKAKEYPEIFRNLLNRKDPNINIGGETVKFSKLQDSYLKNASSGYIDTEVSLKTHPDDLMTTKLQDSIRPYEMPPQLKAAGDVAKKIHSKVSNMSQAREDLGRLVHYKHAMDEEYAFNRAKGYSKEKSWANAEEAAQARVNRFKFDYDALTPWEKKLRKYGIPFYTYMRKATPVLLENMLMNPRYFNVIQQLQQQMAPSEEWQNTREPSWQREQNLSLLTDDTQPWGFTDAISPIRTVTDALSPLANIISPSKLPGSGGRDIAEQLSPWIQAPFELASGKDVFSGKPVTNIGDVLKNKWKGIGQFGSLSGPKDPLEKALYAGGLPIYHVTDEMQATKGAELKQTMRDKLVSYNNQLESAGYRLEISEGKISLVQPKSPTAQEERDGVTPRYPPNKKRKVLGVYSSFDEIPFKFKD